MKKIIFNLAIVAIFTTSISSYSNAQSATDISSSDSKKVSSLFLTPEEKAEMYTLNANADDPVGKEGLKSMKANLKAAKASYKATSHFAKNFENAADVSWRNINNLLTVSFQRGDMYSKVIYDKKGNFRFSIINSYERDLPADIKTVIKRQFEDYKIILVQEISEPTAKAYVVHMEDENNLKQVIIRDGELTVYKEYKKRP